MKRAELMQKLREEAVRQVSYGRRSDGIRALYEAAIMMSDTALAETYREQLHSVLDEILDSVSSVSILSRQIAQATD